MACVSKPLRECATAMIWHTVDSRVFMVLVDKPDWGAKLVDGYNVVCDPKNTYDVWANSVKAPSKFANCASVEGLAATCRTGQSFP